MRESLKVGRAASAALQCGRWRCWGYADRPVPSQQDLTWVLPITRMRNRSWLQVREEQGVIFVFMILTASLTIGLIR